MAKLIDPLQALTEARKAKGELSAAQVIGAAPRGLSTPAINLIGLSLDQAIRADFRVLLTLIWRFLLGNDPNPIQLDMAYWLQHGPDRAIIMAFRGFSKSWITGAYALWCLYCNSEEKIMVVSGSMKRAVATSTWCFQLIMTMDIFAHMRPTARTRQSATAWDVGNCTAAQSASFTPFGIGGQLVGFRGTLIIPDDVETQTNSLTQIQREKVREGVKEFDSVLVPGGKIKYLGTPHDVDSLYEYLLGLRDEQGAHVYKCMIWPALYPSAEQIKMYGNRLAPYILAQIKKLGPTCVGHSTMPMRFTDEDLALRKAGMGNSEFILQFMLDLTGSLTEKYPLKLKDLSVITVDPKKGPEDIVYGDGPRCRELPTVGLDGDFFHEPIHVGSQFSPWDRKAGYLDGSGRGKDETALTVGATLAGRAFALDGFYTQDGYSPATLKAIAKKCVRWYLPELFLEDNFGDGMMTSLLRPVVDQEWKEHLAGLRAKGLGLPDVQGTTLIEVKSSNVSKEKRILSVMEPVTQQHRLVVSKDFINYDYESMNLIDGTEGKSRYGLFYQYTHLTREKDSLQHDDRLESLSGLLGQFGAELSVDPIAMAVRSRDDKERALMAELEADAWRAVGRGATYRDRYEGMAIAARPQTR